MAATLPYAWAEDTNYAVTADPWSNTATKVAPSAQSQTKGLIPESPVGAQEVNYIINKLAHMYGAVLVAPATNFLRDYTFVTLTPTLVRFDPTSKKYIAVNATADTVWGGGYGATLGGDYENWETTTELSGGLLTGSSPLFDLCFSASSNICGIYNGNSQSRYFTAGGAWSGGALPAPLSSGAASCQKPSVCYDPVTDRFVAVLIYGGNAGVSGWWVSGTTAGLGTAATAPAGFTFAAGSGVTVGADGVGGVVAVNFDVTSNVLRFSKSTDGGTTWSASTASAALGWAPAGGAGSQGRFCQPVWNGKYWMVIATNGTSFGGSKVFISADGVNWTLQSTQGGASATELTGWLVNLGDLWVSTAIPGNAKTKIQFSTDAGITWHYTDQSVSTVGSAHCIFSNGQRLFVITTSGTAMKISVATGLGI